MSPMRRRIRSAAVPVHRHSLPQLAVDGLLVALAYYLAFRLRFDGGIPPRYEELFEATVVPVVAGAVVIFALFGMYQKWWRYFGPARLRGGRCAPWSSRRSRSPAYIALVHPVERRRAAAARSRSRRPPASIALFFLLIAGADRAARACSSATVHERPLRGFRAAPRRARRADRRRRRRRPPGPARDRAQPGAAATGPVGFVDDDPRKRGMRMEGVRVLGRTDELARDPRRGRARRGDDRDPLGAGHAARPRRRRPAARAASRSARCRPSSSCCRPARERRAPGARGAGRGRARPRARAHGARARRRAT